MFIRAAHSQPVLVSYAVVTMLVRVITPEAREDGKSTKLKDLIAEPTWAEAVEASPLANHYLSAM